MAKEFSRITRVAELIQQEIAMLVQREIRNPNLALVTISAVEVSKDMAHAKVYVSVFGSELDITQSLEILNSAAPYLRSLLAKKIRLRAIPQLKFYYDSSISYGSKLAALIDKAIEKDK
ncbi:30S ribosome-binding factor RbfA [soil metagenome]